MERVVCRWPSCGKVLFPAKPAKFIRCDRCGHMTCLSCDASHEGANCETFLTQSMIVTPDTPVRASGDVRACGDAQASLHPVRAQQTPLPRTSLAGGTAETTMAQTSPRKEARSAVSPSPTVKQTPTPRTSLAGASPGTRAAQTGLGTTTRSPASPVKPRTEQSPPGAAFGQSTLKRTTTVPKPQKTVRCANEGCGDEVSVDLDETELPCYTCRNTTCLLCNAIHRDLTCEEYQKQTKIPIGTENTRRFTVQRSPGAGFPQSAGKRETSPSPKKTVHCANEECGFELSVDVDDTELLCYKCRNTTCLLCNAIHRDLTCEEYQKQLSPPVEEEEIRVRCAGSGCRFTAFVGVSALQLCCPMCKRITCIKCRAEHEFETCEEYEANRRRSSAEKKTHSRTLTASTLAEETEQRLHISESSTGSRPSGGFGSALREDVLPPFAASSETPARRDAPRQEAILVQRAANEAQPANETVMLECCHCLAESPYEDIIEVLSCGHFLCTECVHEAAVGSLTYLVLCPVVAQGSSTRCQSHIQESALKKVMSSAEHERRKELLALPILRCAVDGCPGKFCARPGVQKIDCPSCKNEFCVPCSASHPGSSCEQFIRVVAGTDAAARRRLLEDLDDSDGSEDDGEDVVGGGSAPTDSD